MDSLANVPQWAPIAVAVLNLSGILLKLWIDRRGQK